MPSQPSYQQYHTHVQQSDASGHHMIGSGSQLTRGNSYLGGITLEVCILILFYVIMGCLCSEDCVDAFMITIVIIIFYYENIFQPPASPSRLRRTQENSQQGYHLIPYS